MILQPTIISLLLICLITTAMVLGSAACAIPILRRWDIGSGSEEQLRLERRTYLVSMMLSYVLALEIGSFFLFIYAADSLHSLFTGAMCAAGTFNVNGYGYPALILKIAGLILAGLWLTLNFVDNRAHDYPLIKVKYALLLLLAPLVIAEGAVDTAFFLGLKGDVITSCCGSLFGSDGRGIAAQMASVPVRIAMPAFFASLGATFASGLFFRATTKGAYLFSAASSANFIISIVALISFISLYFYELPTHHCPFCILQEAYGYVGYPLYGSLLAGGISGLGVGLLASLKKTGSLWKILPRVQRFLALACLTSYTLFAAISVWQMVFSRLTLR
jgi:hypothetical protein